jgi:hypothetical protein
MLIIECVGAELCDEINLLLPELFFVAVKVCLPDCVGLPLVGSLEVGFLFLNVKNKMTSGYFVFFIVIYY